MLKNITAQSCREMADSWENTEVCLVSDRILSEAWNEACKGGLEVQVRVASCHPNHFYKTLQEKLENLGFKIERHSTCWTISW